MGLAGTSGSQDKPGSGRSLWEAPHPVWVDGPGTCRTAQAGRTWLAVAGDCYASQRQLDAALVAVRAGRWRELTGWPGSYWVAATDGVKTVVIGDVAGVRPVYYARRGDDIVWAAEAGLLAAHTGADIDLTSVIAWMAAPTVPELAGHTTVYRGVARVPAGRLLELPTGAVVDYEPATCASHDPADARYELRHALTSSVEARAAAHPRLSADLSGGVDSTCVAAAAAHASPRRLPAFTHHPYLADNDDLMYAQRAVDALPGVLHRVVPGSARWFDHLDRVPATDLPYADAARWAVHAEYLQVIAADGSDAHLTGGGGDTLFAPPAYALADLARAGQWRWWLAETTARARLRHRPVAAAVRAGLADASCGYPGALRRLSHSIVSAAQCSYAMSGRRGHHSGWLLSPGIAAWFTRDAALDVGQALMQAADAAPRLSGAAQAAYRLRCDVVEYGGYHAQYAQAVRQAGVHLHAPMLDNQVVRAALARPAWERLSRTSPKPLLAAALTGMVPAEILSRATKGSLAQNAYAGVATNHDNIRDVLASSRLVDAGLIDHRRAAADVALLAAGVPGRMAALELLLSAELWLARHQLQPPGSAVLQGAR
ncbi:MULTISPECIES: albusnodin/ikarugamycin family macrolactam cyclase [unclassified Nonomuraea]